MTHRRVTSCLAIMVAVGLLPALAPAPAAARWNIHNSNVVTQMTAPPGGTENQTCPGQLVGETGWSTFIATGEDPSAFEPDPDTGAYEPTTYEVWKAPAGFSDFNLAEAQFDNDGQIVGYVFPGGAAAELVKVFSTPDRTLLEEPIPTDAGSPDGGTFVFTAASFSEPLPASVVPGDVLGIKPTGQSSLLILTVVTCDQLAASGTDITAVKKRRFTGVVATFTGGGSAGDYVATIDWADGTGPSAGTITADSDGFVVTGAHAYGKKGTYLVRVTITEVSTGTSVEVTSRAVVSTKAGRA